MNEWMNECNAPFYDYIPFFAHCSHESLIQLHIFFFTRSLSLPLLLFYSFILLSFRYAYFRCVYVWKWYIPCGNHEFMCNTPAAPTTSSVARLIFYYTFEWTWCSFASIHQRIDWPHRNRNSWKRNIGTCIGFSVAVYTNLKRQHILSYRIGKSNGSPVKV